MYGVRCACVQRAWWALVLGLGLAAAVPPPSPPPSPSPSPSPSLPACRAGIAHTPCLVEDACARTAAHRMECWANVVAHAETDEKFSGDYISPSMNLHVDIVEATEKKQNHFVEVAIRMEVPRSTEWGPVYSQIDLFVPMNKSMVNLLINLRHFEIALSSFVDIAAVSYLPDSNALVVDPEMLRAVDWGITVFKVECNDPYVLQSNWNTLEKKFNLTHLAVKRCNFNFHLESQFYLKSLEIESCNLHLPIGFFQKIPNIFRLSLSSNNLTTLPRGIFHLKNLQQLELSGNNLISPESFFALLSTLPNLQILHLSMMHLTSLLQLNSILNTSASQLIGLHLLKCQLISLQEEDINLLSKQEKLEVLDLSNNKIGYITNNWKKLPTSVKILNLSSNFLTSVEFEFASEVELKVIDVSNNRFKAIGNLLQTGRTEFFNISYNNISEVHGFNYGRNINHLNLSYNLIQNVTDISVLYLNTLQSVDFGGNYFNCEVCNINILQKWIAGQHNVKIVALNSTGDLLCFPKHRNLRLALVRQEECENVLFTRNPEWMRVFTISLVLSLIFLTIVLLRGYKFETCYLMTLWQNRTDKSSSISQNYQYDAFVCYSSVDREWVVNELMESLEGAPHFYQFCDHERDFTLGSFITQNVLQSMHLSRHILFVISEAFFNSQWCLWELEMARHRQFEGGGSSPILLQLTPLDQSNNSDGVKILLDSCRALHKSDDPLFWNKLINMLGPSLASSSTR